MLRSLVLAFVSLWAGSPLTAQRLLPDLSRGDVVLLDVDIDPASPATFRVRLEPQAIYRAAFNRRGVALLARAPHGRPLPFIAADESVAGSDDVTSLEIHTSWAGEVELLPDLHGSIVPVRFVLFRDGEVNPLAGHAGRTWRQLGFEIQAGIHPRYTSGGLVRADAGVTYGACLAVRNGPVPSGAYNGCVIGIAIIGGGPEPQHAIVFTEPRFRFNGRNRPPTGWAREYGGTLRLGWVDDPQGGQSIGYEMGIGGYLALDQQVDHGARPGWRFLITLRAQRNTLDGDRWSPVLALGTGRYW